MARRCCLVGVVTEVLLAGVCVLALAFLSWQMLSRLFRPEEGQPVCLLIPGRGEGEELEQWVRSLMWLRGLGVLSCPLVIADVDLTPDGWELALHLAARWPDVVLWPAGQLEEYLKTS